MYASVRNGCTVTYEGFERLVSTQLRRSDSLGVPLLTKLAHLGFPQRFCAPSGRRRS
jgi:hypothetical protein